MNDDAKTPIFGDLLYDKNINSAQGAEAGSLKPKEVWLNAMIPGGSWEGLSGLLKNSLASLELTTKNVVSQKKKVFKSKSPKSRKPKLGEELKIWRRRLSDIRQAQRYLELVNEFRTEQEFELAICHCFNLGRLFERIQVRSVEIDNWAGQRSREGGKRAVIDKYGTDAERAARDKKLADNVAALIRHGREQRRKPKMPYIMREVAISNRVSLDIVRRAWSDHGPSDLKRKRKASRRKPR